MPRSTSTAISCTSTRRCSLSSAPRRRSTSWPRRASAPGPQPLSPLSRTAPPIDELAEARFAPRPAYRPGSTPGIGGIRAIPWGFGWTQIRLMLTGWLGAGTALAQATSTPEGVERLRRMAARWPFFDDLLGKIEMVCAKTDLEIARTYVRQLGGDLELLGRLEEEFHKTTDAVLRIRNTEHL